MSPALLRQAHRIMKCNYHKEIVFLFSFLLANISVHGSVAIQTKINISVNKSKVINVGNVCSLSWKYTGAFGEKCQAVSSFKQMQQQSQTHFLEVGHVY